MDCDCLVDCQGAHSHKEGQEDQGEVKELGGGTSFLGHLSHPSGLQVIQGPLRFL